MDRRTFVKGAATATAAANFSLGAGVFDGGQAQAQSDRPSGAGRSGKPNILVIKVDQLRFPTVFPAGINSTGDFLRRYMPNLHQLWQSGVKFANHYTAACACTPARGTMITGLYSQQSWLVQTILAKPGVQLSLQPWLNPAFPTYGKFLRQLGYQTPYIGKWHVSIPPQNTPRLDAYGFDGLTFPDPTGSNLQGAYGDYSNSQYPYRNDADIANQGAQWLQQHGTAAAPWCLTVSLINPHDKEFFWAGTEFQTYSELFSAQTAPLLKPFTLYSTTQNPPVVPWSENALKSPGQYGYASVPPNWETGAQIAARKPSTQAYSRLFQELVWGGVTDDPAQQNFTIAQYPPSGYTPIPVPSPYAAYGIGVAPFSYWQRSLDSYTQIMQVADGAIGQILQAVAALPSSVLNNTIIVFTSDHGDYAGAHGFLSGKVGALYDEAYHVPLIVVDPSGRHTGDVDVLRQGLTSSVDLLPLLVSIGYGGRSWLTGNLGQIYGERHDLLAMLRSAQAPGRQYVLLATDEAVPSYYNFNDSPTHLVGVRTQGLKLGVYANWQRGTAQIADDSTLETEFYDYATPAGQAELDNLQHDQRIPALKQALLTDIIPNVLRAPLPGLLGAAQIVSRDAYLVYDAVLRRAKPQGSSGDASAAEILASLPFGQDF